MQSFKKISIASALALALGFSSQTMAIPLPQKDLTAGMSTFTDLAVNPTGEGQALIFPYYNTREGMRTNIHITNTSGDIVIAKVIIREGKTSHDALNFTVVLSPYDQWVGQLRELDGVPKLIRADTSCVVGAFSERVNGVQTAMAKKIEPLKTLGIPSSNQKHIAEGHITVIAQAKVVMGNALAYDTDPLSLVANKAKAYRAILNAVHVSSPSSVTPSKPRNCQKVSDLFIPDRNLSSLSNTGITNTINSGDVRDVHGVMEFTYYDVFQALGDGDNPLVGAYTLLTPKLGTAGGGRALAIANFNKNETLPLKENLLTAQAYPYNLEPTLASSHGLWGGADNQGLSALQNVEAALSSTQLVNEWVYKANAGNNARADWVVTLPTKFFYSDSNIYSGSADGIRLARDTTKGNYGSAEWDGDLYYTVGAYDREEKKANDFVEASPSEGGRKYLENEVNVISFGPDKGKDTNNSILQTLVPANIDLNGNIYGQPAGWLAMSFRDGSTGTVPQGVPAVGFMYRARFDINDPHTSYAEIISHVHSSK